MEKYKNFDLGLNLDPESSFYYESLIDNKDGLKLFHKDSKNNLRLVLTFGVVSCYRVANESFRLKLQDNTHKKLSGIVSIVENSEFLEWFHKESKEIYINDGLKHYLIFSADDVFDVLSQGTVKALLEKI